MSSALADVYGQTHDREASQRAGFHEHLVKPVTLATLDQVLSRLGAGSKGR